MARGITWLLLACFIAHAVTGRAQDGSRGPAERDLRTSLNRGDLIAIELTDRERLRGVVGARLNTGFEIQLPDAERPRFVKYGDVRAWLDPDTGEILGYTKYVSDPVDRRWVGPVVVSLAVVGVLALLTRGFFPACLFQSCR